MDHRPNRFAVLFVSALAVTALAAGVRADESPVQFGVEGSGGIAGLALKDFVKAASDRGGSADTSGWTAGGRGIIFIPGGLGFSAGIVEDGGGSYAATVSGYNKKKATNLTIVTSAKYTERSFPVSLQFRSSFGRVGFGAEGGVDFTTGTVAYSESDSNGGAVSGDLTKGGTGFHVAAEGTLKISDSIWGFVRAGYMAVNLKDFTGTLNDNGTQKAETLYMVKNTASSAEDLEVSTSTSVTSVDHRPAEVSGSGYRLTVGLRILFP